MALNGTCPKCGKQIVYPDIDGPGKCGGHILWSSDRVKQEKVVKGTKRA